MPAIAASLPQGPTAGAHPDGHPEAAVELRLWCAKGLIGTGHGANGAGRYQAIVVADAGAKAAGRRIDLHRFDPRSRRPPRRVRPVASGVPIAEAVARRRAVRVDRPQKPGRAGRGHPGDARARRRRRRSPSRNCHNDGGRHGHRRGTDRQSLKSPVTLTSIRDHRWSSLDHPGASGGRSHPPLRLRTTWLSELSRDCSGGSSLAPAGHVTSESKLLRWSRRKRTARARPTR